MYSNCSHSERTCVLLEIPSIYTLVQYFHSLYKNKDLYELKVYIFPTLKLIFFQAVLNIVVYQMLIVTNVPVNTAVYSVCYSVRNPCRYWTSQTLSALVSYWNTLYNVMRTKRHIARRSSSKCHYQCSGDQPYSPGCNHWCPML